MKRSTSIGLYAAVFAVTVGILGINGLGFTPSGIAQTASTNMEGYPILGHITLVAKDASGNVKSYLQTDNTVTQIGENCVVRHLFDNPTTSSQTWNAGNCNSNNNFKGIGIGSGTAAATDAQTALVTEVLRAGATSFSLTAAGSGAGAHAVLAKTFTGTTQTIAEAGVFDANSTGTGNMLARQTFTGIPLSASDSLTINWDIKFGP